MERKRFVRIAVLLVGVLLQAGCGTGRPYRFFCDNAEPQAATSEKMPS